MAKEKPASKHAPGQYVGTVVGQRLGESAGKGTPYVEFDVLLTHKLAPGTSQEIELEDAFKVSTTVYLTAETFAKAQAGERLRSVGFEGSDPTQLDPSSPKHQDLTDNKVQLYHGAKDAYDWQIATKAAKKSNPAVAAKLTGLFARHLGGSGSAKPATQKAAKAAPPKQEKPKPEAPPKKEEPPVTEPVEDTPVDGGEDDDCPF